MYSAAENLRNREDIKADFDQLVDSNPISKHTTIGKHKPQELSCYSFFDFTSTDLFDQISRGNYYVKPNTIMKRVCLWMDDSTPLLDKMTKEDLLDFDKTLQVAIKLTNSPYSIESLMSVVEENNYRERKNLKPSKFFSIVKNLSLEKKVFLERMVSFQEICKTKEIEDKYGRTFYQETMGKLISCNHNDFDDNKYNQLNFHLSLLLLPHQMMLQDTTLTVPLHSWDEIHAQLNFEYYVGVMLLTFATLITLMSFGAGGAGPIAVVFALEKMEQASKKIEYLGENPKAAHELNVDGSQEIDMFQDFSNWIIEGFNNWVDDWKEFLTYEIDTDIFINPQNYLKKKAAEINNVSGKMEFKGNRGLKDPVKIAAVLHPAF